MHYHVAKIKHKPAFAGLSFDTSSFLIIFLGCFQNALGKRVEHTVTGTAANHEIIGKRCNVFDVQKQDVFALMVLQSVDDFMGKV